MQICKCADFLILPKNYIVIARNEAISEVSQSMERKFIK
jgi:hypothetical protein